MMKRMAAMAAAFLMLMGTAEASGSLAGVVKAPPVLDFEVISSGGGRGGGRGAAGIGFSIGGTKKQMDKSVRLQLISRTADFSRLSDQEIEAWYKDGIAPAKTDVFIGTSGEDGTYAFTDVPAGSYYLVIVAPGLAKSTPARSRATQELSKRLRNWDLFELFTLGMHDYAVHLVEVKDEAATRFDYDFSAPPFAGK